MKKSTFCTEFSNKALKLVKSIIKTEALNLGLQIKENALGDTMIEVTGNTNEIIAIREVYNMVK